MARILAVSSQVAYGPVGNSAAVPALQARGHEVLAVPTVTLSNHPGHGAPAGFRTEPSDLAAILRRLETLGVLGRCSAVMTGYFATPEQVEITARTIRSMKAANSGLYVLVDPVIGDGDRLYVPQAVAEAIRDHLVPLADCLTPNRFELEWLSGLRAGTIEAGVAAARRLPVPEVLATSIPAGEGKLATLAIAADTVSSSVTPLRPTVPHGTGDFLAGLYLAERLAHPPAEALPATMLILRDAIEASAGSTVLDIAGTLHSWGNFRL
ncbi:MAG: bifunctional hydroxymethylpyrimidine kinase/phosphomethylpyrimidine kinase [Rhizobiales bacterium]|nr:bifunctional hydroxymethylpyrimidine kinase/phosphomethylpyrimidine kinase [Hyphomicrobiales bacterium]MBI3674436.1 bifunctional hydroxymethylpyrimidine kinase/phosphomethylpyrimidine kinase [Hyphomicrobiales bacterium]